jgi:hypothetical protein
MRSADYAAFRAWFDSTLSDGGAWFTALWPHPDGEEVHWWHFVNVPQWQFIGGGFWIIDATLEALPYVAVPECFVEDFDDGLTPYSLVSVSGSPQTYFGITSALTWSGSAALELSVSSVLTIGGYYRSFTPVLTRVFTMYFRLVTLGNDDALAVQISDGYGGTNLLGVNISREPGADPSGLGRIRATFGPTSDERWLSSARPAEDVWHRLQVVFSADANGTTYELKRMDSSTVVDAGTVTGTYPPATVSTLVFGMECSGAGYSNTGAVVDRVSCCP